MPSTARTLVASSIVSAVRWTARSTYWALSVGQSRTINITVFAPNTPGDYPNQSIVDPDNAIPEGNEFNNNSNIVTKVRTVGDGGQNAFNELTITKTQTAPGGQFGVHQQRRDLRDRGRRTRGRIPPSTWW